MSYEEIRCSCPRAKKEYKCVWCGEKILVGEVHTSRAYRFDGCFQSDRMHMECVTASGKLSRDEIDEGFLPGEFVRGGINNKFDCITNPTDQKE